MAFQGKLKTMMARILVAGAADRGDRGLRVEPPRKFTDNEYNRYLKDTSSFIQDWWSALDSASQSHYQPFVEAVCQAQENGHLIAGESLVMNLANRLGAGATMQTTKVGLPQQRVIWVNRDFLDEMMECGAEPAEVAAGLVHEGVHVIQGMSRFGLFHEWPARQVYDPNSGNHTVRKSMESYFKGLAPSEQSRYTQFGPFGRRQS